MGFSWTDLRDEVEDTALDFKNQTAKITGFGNNADDIDEAITDLTTESYSQIYGTYQKLVDLQRNSDNLFEGTEIANFIPTANIQSSGTTEYGTWDPRLSRIDGFLSTTKDQSNAPVVVPFSSASAAGAFFDLTFHVESAVAKMIIDGAKKGNSVGNNESTIETSMTKDVYNAINIDPNKHTEDSGADYSGSEQVYLGSRAVLNSIKRSGDSYGLASIVNPYTLTKLCGGIVLSKQNPGENNAIENRLYDIRDQRRFYDKSVVTENDALSITNPTTTNIITYSNRDPWGRTPYFFQDFVFCKYWNIIPNNRLITLRKYHAPVYDNLQFASMYANEGTPAKVAFAPIATVVTYFGDDTGNTLQQLTSFTTGVKWKDIPAAIHEVSGDSGSNPRALIDDMFSNANGFTGAMSEIGQSIQGAANVLTGKLISFGKFTGLLSPNGYDMSKDENIIEKYNAASVDPTQNLYNNKIIGPVNRVDSTKARDAGITFDHKLSLTCQYVARPIGGVNTKAAMLDILANCLEIASVDAMFWGGGYRFMIKPHSYPFKNTPFSNKIMDDLYAGRIFGKDGALAHMVEGVKSLGTDENGNWDWGAVVDKLSSVIGQTLGALGELFSSITNVLFGGTTTLSEWLNKAGDTIGGEGTAEKGAMKLNNLGKNLNNMWRSQVIQRSIMPTVNGMKALLTGDPVGNWHVTVGNPLNPIMVIGNLICTDMKFEFSEEMGPDDFPLELKVVYSLEHGMARDKASIQSMFNRGNGKIYELPDYIRASSDYETKVDKYTGPNGKGWFTPKMMSPGTYGASGYNTWKLAEPTQLAMNSHTDNVLIAKFTPVDVDAAISNIKNDSTFFTAYSGSRAIIRGTAMTRKFMN